MKPANWTMIGALCLTGMFSGTAVAQEVSLDEASATEQSYNEAEERMSRLLRLQTIQRKLDEASRPQGGQGQPAHSSTMEIPPDLLKRAIESTEGVSLAAGSRTDQASAKPQAPQPTGTTGAKQAAPTLLWTTTSASDTAAMIIAAGMQNSVRVGSSLPGGWVVELIVPNGVKLRRGKEVKYLKAGQ